jgi:hypothetical protein
MALSVYDIGDGIWVSVSTCRGQQEVFSNFVDHLSRDRFVHIGVCQEEGIIADEIDLPWDPCRVCHNPLQCFWSKNVLLLVACRTETVKNVRSDIPISETIKLAVQGYSLGNLSERRLSEESFELRLTSQHEGQERLGKSFP